MIQKTITNGIVCLVYNYLQLHDYEINETHHFAHIGTNHGCNHITNCNQNM